MTVRNWNKVFEVGSPKTGTSSLGLAYTILGLKQKGWDPKLHEQYRQGDYSKILSTAEKYDAFQDGPWHADGMYKVFDEVFPHSKFILLERDLESWIRSYRNHFSVERNCNHIDRKYLLDNFESRKEMIVEHHLQRYAEIKEYFKDRPDDLLVMNVCAGEGWEKLCPFLELASPDQSFPFGNKTQDTVSWYMSRVRRVVSSLFKFS